MTSFLNPDEYVNHLCDLNLTDSEIGMTTQQSTEYSSPKGIPAARRLSFAFCYVWSESSRHLPELTNVGPAFSLYYVRVVPPQGVEMGAEPEVVAFTETKQTITFSVAFT